jgi:glyoxylase-like metal-dependent hydrolase (beta-lactamase superfamily II)
MRRLSGAAEMRSDFGGPPVASWAREPWGALEAVGENVWAMLSTPLADRTTLCNGGLIAGRDGVLLVEAFGSDAGARWMRERARALTRREPSQVLLTHYHGDHTGGLTGAREAGAELWCTARTRDDVIERNQNAPVHLLGDAMLVPDGGERVLDLGGRRVRLIAMDGHTASDAVAVVEDAGVVFTGDLVWYGMFPNFVDARPSRLTQSVRRLRALDARVYVSGHGVATDAAGVDAFIDLLDLVERAAREAQAAGLSAAAAAATFRMPAAMADWTLFSPRYFERALGAWIQEISAR